MFRNAQAVIKNNKSLRDYAWLCQLDITKGIDIGETYLNSKAAMKFVYAIAQSERKKTITRLNSSIFSVMMDAQQIYREMSKRQFTYVSLNMGKWLRSF